MLRVAKEEPKLQLSGKDEVLGLKCKRSAICTASIVLLGKAFSSVLIGRVRSSEAEGKDSGTFLCAGFRREPHQSGGTYVLS